MHVHLVQHDVVSTAEFWWEFGNLDSHQASAASSGHLPCLSDFRPGYRNTFNIFIWYGKHSRDMSVNLDGTASGCETQARGQTQWRPHPLFDPARNGSGLTVVLNLLLCRMH